MTQAPLQPSEIDELVAICKGVSPAVPLEDGHLRDPGRDQGEVYLRQLHSVRHVNALAPDQRLLPAPAGALRRLCTSRS